MQPQFPDRQEPRWPADPGSPQPNPAGPEAMQLDGAEQPLHPVPQQSPAQQQPASGPYGPILPGRWYSPLQGRFAAFAVCKVAAWSLLSLLLVVLVTVVAAKLLHIDIDLAVLLVGSVSIIAVAVLFGIWRHVVLPLGFGWSIVGLRKPEHSMANLFWQVPLLIIGAGLVQLIFTFIVLRPSGVSPPKEEGISDALISSSPLGVVAIIVAISVIVPIWEELFFRGLLFGALRSRLTRVPAALIGGGVFAAVHFVPLALPFLLTIGIGLCLLAEWYKSVIPGMVVHGINNAIVAISLLSPIQ